MATKTPKKSVGRKKKPNGYQMPGHIPAKEVLKDTAKNEWVVDVSIGVGGFGEIYSAFKATDLKHNDYVVKIEPSENGPLFCERTVYIRIGKKEDIDEFMKLRKLKSLGMPMFYGFGSHYLDGTKYRFLVMERYGRDLWSLFLENQRIFPTVTVLTVGLQVLDVLDYLHSKSYIHADVKGANLLLGRKKGTENQVYLVDFGLACRYSTSDFKPDPKKAHNGTLEYTSRDAHLGAATRRGDLEIVGYNMLQWLASKLPWEKLTDPSAVHSQKNKYMDDCDALMKISFKGAEFCEAIKTYFQYISQMEPMDAPDYFKLKRILTDGIKKFGKHDGKLEFTASKTAKTKTPRSTKKKKYEDSLEEAKRSVEEEPEISKARSPKKTDRKPKTEVKRSWRDFPTIVNGAMTGTSNGGPPPAKIQKKSNK